jgi:hypothetical protein
VKRPRFRIASVMAHIAIAAFDFAVIRAMPVIGPPTSELLVVGALPMGNVLAVGLLARQRRAGSRPFLLGFAAFGVLALALYVALVVLSPQTVADTCIKPLLPPISSTIGPSRPRVLVWQIASVCSVAVVLLGLPQLAFALLGGYLSRKFGIAQRPGRTHC